MGGVRFGITEDGQPGYKKDGADTVYPFNTGLLVVDWGLNSSQSGNGSYTRTPKIINNLYFSVADDTYTAKADIDITILVIRTHAAKYANLYIDDTLQEGTVISGSVSSFIMAELVQYDVKLKAGQQIKLLSKGTYGSSTEANVMIICQRIPGTYIRQ